MNEAIVDKLQGTLTILRRERDEVHRAKELAMERLRLVKEERVSFEERLEMTQRKYDDIVAATSTSEVQLGSSGVSTTTSTTASIQADIQRLEAEVERVRRETRFQHMELVAKRENVAQYKRLMKDQEAQRSAHKRRAKDALKVRRAKVANLHARAKTVSSSSFSSGHGRGNDPTSDDSKNDVTARVEQIRNMLSLDDVKNHNQNHKGGNDTSVSNSLSNAPMALFVQLQRLAEKKAKEYHNDAQSIRRNAEIVQKRIQGYQDYMARMNGNAGNVHIRNHTMSSLEQ